MKITAIPLGNRVLIQLINQQKTRKSGLVLPEKQQESVMTGTVVGLGCDTEHLYEGFVVVFLKSSGIRTSVGDSELIVIKESDILFYIKTEEE